MKFLVGSLIKKLKCLPLILILSQIFSIAAAHAQSKDTATAAQWVNEMQNKNVNILNANKAFEAYWKNRPITKSSGYKVYKRWAYMRELEMDSLGFPRNPGIKERTFQEEFFGVNELRGIDSATECVFDTVWTPIGPRRKKDAGRANAIAFHPSNPAVFLLGTASGGLWKSSDNGKSWTELIFNGNTKGISSIAWDKSDSNVIYIGTGDFNNDAIGNGVFKSIDGGKSWQPINNGISNQLIVKCIVIDPRNSNIVLIGTNSGIYRSINGGKNWKQCNYPGGINIRDLEMNPALSNWVIATSDDRCYFSKDSGKTFTLSKGISQNGYRGALSTTIMDSSYVYFLLCDVNVFKGVYRSVNFGDSFALMSSTPNLMDYSSNGSGNSGQAFYCMDIVVNPKDKNDVYVGGVNIFRSTNGGKNWIIYAHWTAENSPYVHADIHRLEFSNTTNKLFAACDGGLYTRNTTWESLSIGLNTLQTYKISTDQSGSVLAGFQDNGTWYNQKAYYPDFINQNDGDGMDNAIDMTQGIKYSSIQYGKIFKNLGVIAANGVNGINEDGDWVTPFILKENDPKIMIAGYKSIWRSTSLYGTISFQNICDINSQANEFINDIENSPVNNNILYFSRKNGGFFRTNSLNANSPSWVNLSNKKPISGIINDIQCSYLDSSTVYIAINDRIYKSSNQGNNWSNISTGLPGIYVYCLAIDSSNGSETLFCGTSNGVYQYINNTSWKKYGKGFPNYVKVTELEVSYNNKNTSLNSLLAATFGQGIWQIPLPNFRNKHPDALISPLLNNIFCVNKSATISDMSSGYKFHHEWLYDTSEISLNYTNSDSSQVQTTFLKSGRLTIKEAVYNCAGSDTTDVDFIIFDNIQDYPCKGKTLFLSNPGEYGIRAFGINNRFIFSGNTKTGGEYEDLKCKTIFNLKPGKYNSISASLNPQAKENIKVYIDLNNDGLLKENEVVYSNNFKSSTFDSFYLSNSVVKNKALLIRVISDYYPIDTTPCPSVSFGQTEDHVGIAYVEKLGIRSNATVACIGDTFTISDSSQGVFNYYHWDFGPDASPKTAIGIGPHHIKYDSNGYKSIKLTVNNDFEETFDSVIYVKGKPNVRIENISRKLPVCTGDTLILTPDSRDTDIITYSWKYNGLMLTQNKNYMNPQVNLNDTGFYQLVAGNSCVADTFNYHFSEIKVKPIVSITGDQNAQCLKNNQFDLVADVISNDPYQIKWDNGNSTVKNSIRFSNSGNHHVILKAFTDYCSDSDLITLNVFPNANSSFTYLNPIALDIQFKPADTSQSTYNWNFGDGNTSNEKLPKHTFSQYAKDYPVQLITYNSNNCQDTSNQTINIASSSIDAIYASHIIIYPNPTNRTILIKIDIQVNTLIEYKLFSNIGQQVKGEVIDMKGESTMNLDLNDISPGWYVLYLSFNNEYYKFKIIKE